MKHFILFSFYAERRKLIWHLHEIEKYFKKKQIIFHYRNCCRFFPIERDELIKKKEKKKKKEKLFNI